MSGKPIDDALLVLPPRFMCLYHVDPVERPEASRAPSACPPLGTSYAAALARASGFSVAVLPRCSKIPKAASRLRSDRHRPA